jgi:hypothetical protein
MGGSWFESFKKRFEDTFHSANTVAGVCSSPTLSQVRDLLEHAEKITSRAKYTAAFANSTDALGAAGEKLGVAAEKIDSLTAKSKTILGDANAACEISEAVSVLNDWSSLNSGISNQDAAKAFDKLFGGAADFFKKLPPPANAYAQILEEIGRVSFFSNMQQLMDPASATTSHGRAMKAVLDTIDHGN